MDFASNRDIQIQEMLKELNIEEVMDLFQAIPSSILCERPIDDDGLSEYEGMQKIEALAKENTFPQYCSYLGGGAYEHHVPAIVSAICQKSEFLTSYTPYQAEISQGLLQAIFEFQSVVCALTGMDVANASVYDASSASAEAILMALRYLDERSKVVIASSLNPRYQAVVEQYLVNLDVEIAWLPFNEEYQIDLEEAKNLIDDKTACVLIQSPNFFGVMEEVKDIVLLAKKHGALVALCANPLSYGIFPSAKELGVDIAVGDMQPLGLPLQFGGPYVGYMACKQDFVRQLPGRIVGETVDEQGRKGFVLTLQAREQHIRREKATSNICSNQALAALATLVTTLWYGKEGIQQLACTNYQRACYLQESLGIQTKSLCFNEFVFPVKGNIEEVMQKFRQSKIIPGISLQPFYPELDHHLLVAVTELKSKEDLDFYVRVARS